jgi:MFS family permease
LGIIEGLADGFAGAARLAGGALSDDPQRRRTVALGGYSATAVLSALIGVSTTVFEAAALRAAGWLARGLRVPPRNALLADVVPQNVYGRAYGLERAMDNLGAVCGPALALLVVAFVSMRTAILLSVIPGLLAALAILTAIRSTPKPQRHDHQPIRLRVRPVMRGPLGRLLVGIAAFELANAAATRVALGLYIAYNVAATVVCIPGGRLADRRGNSPGLIGGVFCFALAYLGFAFTGSSITLLGLSFVAAGFGIGIVETAEHSAVACLAPAAMRGSAFGLLAGVQSLANLAASAVAGALWTLVSPRLAFLYLLAWSMAAGVLLSFRRAV